MPTHLALWYSLKEVFRDIRYVVIALGFGFLAFVLSLWLHNLRLVADVIASPLFALPDKALFLTRLLGGIVTNTTPLSAVLIVIMSVVFGVNAALLMYSFRRRTRTAGVGTKGMTVGGIISAVFGVGCASCGTYLLGATLSSIGASGALASLPLRGQEFLWLSTGLLLMSVVWSAKSLAAARVCPMPVKQIEIGAMLPVRHTENI